MKTMTVADKKRELKSLIYDTLRPLVNSDYVLLDCPYYLNTGDVLIWRGAQQFLSSLPYRCLGQYSLDTFRDNGRIKPSTVIVMTGGGNFGDLWRSHQEFRLRIAETYPENRIVMLPQSVWYENEQTMLEDAAQLGRHRDLTICARDNQSYGILNRHFSNNILLLPDMAFCIDDADLTSAGKPDPGRTLWLFRDDKELSGQKHDGLIPAGAEKHDWPAFEHISLKAKIMKALLRELRWLRRINAPALLVNCACSVTDRYVRGVFEKHILRQGTRFVGRYQYVYTTRLHTGILAVLLQRDCCFIDNSYGKNSAFYTTWLQGTQNISLLTQTET